MIRLSKVVKCPIDIEIKDESTPASEKDFHTRCLDLFNAIDGMGHYTNSACFMTLNLRNLRLVRELTEIWNYRANIPLQMRRQICPPYGDPFEISDADLFTMENENARDEQRKMVLTVLERLVQELLRKTKLWELITC